jgi:hypothetical protein
VKELVTESLVDRNGFSWWFWWANAVGAPHSEGSCVTAKQSETKRNSRADHAPVLCRGQLPKCGSAEVHPAESKIIWAWFEHVFEPTTVVGSFNSLSSTGSRNGNFLAGGLEHEWIMTFPSYWDILGMSSSQLTLTPSFFREVGSTTNQFLL